MSGTTRGGRQCRDGEKKGEDLVVVVEVGV